MTSGSEENGQGIKIKRPSELLRVGMYDDTLAVNIGEGRPILATFPRRTFFGIAITDTTRAHAAEMLGQGAIKPKKASGAGSSPADNGRKSRGRGR